MATTALEAKVSSPLNITVNDRALIVRFPREYDVLSWAPWNHGHRKAAAVINLNVDRCADREKFPEVLSQCGLPDSTVGLMTVADVSQYQECFLSIGKLWVHAVATVGLTNARSVLDEALRIEKPGTINIVLASNMLSTLEVKAEAIHVAAAAKASAFYDRKVTSRKSDLPAALTGTDCMVIASSGEFSRHYCGMHTESGELVGRAVYDVVSRGIDRFMASDLADVRR